MGWGDIPRGLRERAQWAMAGLDKAPQWFDETGRLRYVSVKEPLQWGAFESVATIAAERGLAIGYIIHHTDPFACIDLDVKDDTGAEQLARYQSILDHMQSYAEVSKSGRGLHIWVQGSIGPGVRRDGVEVYSQERFIICTGDRVNGFDIENRQDMLTGMVHQMRPIRDELTPELVEVEPIYLDLDIINRGFNAANGDKFQSLWSGGWADAGYQSQSEADFALINMLAFYSDSNSQVRRLFRESELGKRKKAQRDDYINRSLKTIRRELEDARSVDVASIKAAMETIDFVNEVKQQEPTHVPPIDSVITPAATEPSTLDWPPGFIGYLAQAIYNMAPRPVKEIAIATAIAHMAGIVGRSWNISQTGLNIYIVVIARSATGKNIIHSAMKKLSKTCSTKFPMYGNFIDGNNYVSAEAFEKSFRARPCSVHHIKELGKLLSRMNNGKDQIMANYARSLLDVYDVSGQNDSVGDIVRAKKEDSVGGVMGPVSFSLIGESTPDVFKSAVTSEAIEDGLMSRFLVVEYKGDRTDLNEATVAVPDDISNWLIQVAQQATQMMNQNKVHNVTVEPAAKAIADSFNRYCDDRIIGQLVEAKRFVWNRAHLMALKIAAILAVSDNCYDPIVTPQRMQYAVDMLKKSIEIRLPTINSSSEPNDENRENDLKRCIGEYLFKDAPANEEFIHASGIVSYRHLTQRVHHLSSFKKSVRGSTMSLKATLQALVESGHLTKVLKSESVGLYNKTGDLYRITFSKKDMEEIFKDEDPAMSILDPGFNMGLAR